MLFLKWYVLGTTIETLTTKLLQQILPLARAKLEQYSDAVADYSKVIELHPDADVYLRRGSGYAILGQYADAITDYSKAIELDPDNASAYYLRGITKATLKQHSGAIIDFDRAIELDPDNASAYYERGIAMEAAAKVDFQTADRLVEAEGDPEKDEYGGVKLVPQRCSMCRTR